MTRKKPSEKIIAHLKKSKRHAKIAYQELCCWSLNKSKIEYTQAQKEKMYEADRIYCQAKALVDEVYAEMIGKQIVSEL